VAEVAVFAEQFAVVGSDDEVGVRRRQLHQAADLGVDVLDALDLLLASISI